MVEEARIEPSDRADNAQRASSVNEAPKEVTDVPLEGVDRELEMSTEPSTTELLSEEGLRQRRSLLWMMLSLSPYCKYT